MTGKPPDLIDANGHSVIGKSISIDPNNGPSSIFFSIREDQEVYAATLTVGVSDKISQAKFKYTTSTISSSSNKPAGKQDYVILELPDIVALISLLVTTSEADVMVRVTYWSYESWIPIAPEYDLQANVRHEFEPPVFSNRLKIEYLLKTTIGGSEIYQPGKATLSAVELYISGQAVRTAISLGDERPFYYMPPLRPGEVHAIKLDQILKPYTKSLDKLSLNLVSEMKGDVIIQEVVSSCYKVLNKFPKNQLTYRADIGGKSPATLRISLPKTAKIQTLQFQETVEMIDESYFYTAMNESGYLLQCDSSRALRLIVSPDKKVEFTGIDIQVEPIFDSGISKITGLFILSESEDATGDNIYENVEFELSREELGTDNRTWISCRPKNEICINNTLYITLSIIEGRVYVPLAQMDSGETKVTTQIRYLDMWSTPKIVTNSLTLKSKVCHKTGITKGLRSFIKRGKDTFDFSPDQQNMVAIFQPKLEQAAGLSFYFESKNIGTITLSDLYITTSS